MLAQSYEGRTSWEEGKREDMSTGWDKAYIEQLIRYIPASFQDGSPQKQPNSAFLQL